MKEGTSRHIGFTSSDSTDGLLSSFLALFAENCSSFSIIFNNFHSQKYLTLFRKNRDAVWFYQVSYKSKRFNNPTILQTFVQFSKFKEIDCKDKIASNILKLWSVLGKHMLKTIVLAQTFDTGCVRRQIVNLWWQEQGRYNFSRVIIENTLSYGRLSLGNFHTKWSQCIRDRQTYISPTDASL